MTNKKRIKFTMKSEWADISRRFCRFHGLPFGSSIKVVYIDNPALPKGRIQRNNTSYARAVFNSKVMERADDEDRVSDLIDNKLLPFVDIDLKAQGADIWAFGPSGRLQRNTSIRSWRSKPAKPTEAEIEARNAQLQEIDEATDECRTAISNISEFRWDPETIVPRAMIRALVHIYGADIAREAFQAELGGK